MRLNVEISAVAGYWDNDKLRRRMKEAIADAVNSTVMGMDNAELNRLQFIVPKPKTRKVASS
jgi:hypothetical protein